MLVYCLCYSAQNISDMLEKQHGIIVGVARINLPAPIKVRVSGLALFPTTNA